MPAMGGKKKITGRGNSLFLSTYLIWQQGMGEIVKSSANTELSSLFSLQHTLSDAQAGREGGPAANFGSFTLSARRREKNVPSTLQ